MRRHQWTRVPFWRHLNEWARKGVKKGAVKYWAVIYFEWEREGRAKKKTFYSGLITCCGLLMDRILSEGRNFQ